MKCWSWVSICRSSWCTSHSKIWEEITWNWWIMSKVFHSFKICMATVSLLAFPEGKSLCIHVGLQDKILDWTGNQFVCDSWRRSYTLWGCFFSLKFILHSNCLIRIHGSIVWNGTYFWFLLWKGYLIFDTGYVNRECMTFWMTKKVDSLIQLWNLDQEIGEKFLEVFCIFVTFVILFDSSTPAICSLSIWSQHSKGLNIDNILQVLSARKLQESSMPHVSSDYAKFGVVNYKFP